jgi:hypothetical protein
MIIWHGRGAVIAAVAFGSLLASELICRAYFHDNTYYQQHGWPKLAAFLVAAGVVWFLQRKQAEALEVANRHVSKEPVLRPRDRLFFVPVSYWPLILCALGVIFYFVRE